MPKQTGRQRGPRRARLTAVALALGLALPLGVAPSAQAYVLHGCKFPSASLRWQGSINAGGGMQGQYPLAAAVSDWSSNTDVNITGPTSSSPHIMINVAPYGNTSWAGRVSSGLSCSGSTYSSRNIQINHTNIGSRTSNEKKAVIAHEIGHTLRLAHNNSYTSCANVKLMYYQADLLWACSRYGTATDDRNGVNAIY